MDYKELCKSLLRWVGDCYCCIVLFVNNGYKKSVVYFYGLWVIFMKGSEIRLFVSMLIVMNWFVLVNWGS